MSSITAQQTKLDLELVYKEKRLEIRKCNGRLNPRKKQREPTFQVALDALALSPCYSPFLITADVLEVYMHQVHGQNFDELPIDEDIVSFFKELGHTGKSRQLQILLLIRCINLGELLPPSSTKVYLERQLFLTSFVFLEHISFREWVTPHKKVRKFKKLASPKLSTVPASPKEPIRKSNRVKRPTKKSFDAPTTGVVIRETPVKSLSKKKEEMTVEKRKGIDLLSKVALTEEAQYEEVRKKSLRDFHKIYLSGSSTITKTTPSVAKIKPSVTNEGTGVKPGVLDVTKEESTKSEAESWEKDEDDNNNEHDSRNSEHETDENESGSKSDQEENEEEIEDDEEEEEDEFVKTPSNDTDDEDETNIKDKDEGDEDEEMDYTTDQFDDDVDLRMNKPITTDEESLEHAVLAKEFSQPNSTYEAVATLIEFELKKILIDKMDESQSYLTVAKHRECYNRLIKSYDLDMSLFSTYDKVYSLKRIRKDKDEDPSAGSDRGLKKRKTSMDAEPTKGPKAKESQSSSSKDAKSQSKSFRKSVQSEEPEFEVADSDMPQDQEKNPGNDDEKPKRKVASKRDWFTKPKRPQEPTDPDCTPLEFSTYIMNELKITNLTQETLLGPAFRLRKGTGSNYAELEYDFEECYKALSEKLDWNNPEGGDYPFDLTKPLPLVMNGNHQIVSAEYFFNNDLKYLQGGISTMAYTTSITKTMAAQYDLPSIEDMVQNIWSPIKVAYDKHVLWGISHWRDQRKTFYGYAQGLESTRDVYSTKRILAETQVEFMRKHRLTNLSGDDVSNFAIALRMFTRSMVIQRRVKDLQLGVENKLYKFNDGTLTRLQTSLNDITKNIRIEYLPQRRWSTLEKKRANIMIKAIDKQLKERRMMRSLKKFVGGRHYGTDL
uniref:Uncharacterized protein n=1 Tax=Tanacetum cinerariifolium TaxID=118510 RepID=A0A6L2L7U0_TANCI|nr:hypothetical protein [Tanacetum cinerariifolium]